MRRSLATCRAERRILTAVPHDDLAGRRLNLRCVLLLATLLTLAGCSSRADRIQAALAKAERLLDASELDKAGIEVRNALQWDSRNPRAHYLGGEIAEARHDLQRAYQGYLRAQELAPADRESAVALARVELLAGDTSKATQRLSALLATDPGNLPARALQVALIARQGDLPAAIAQAEVLLAAQPDMPVQTQLLLAGLFVQAGQPARALALVEQGLKTQPGQVALLSVAARICDADPPDAARAARAVGFYRHASELAPRDTGLWLAWAGHHLQRHETDAAESVLRAAVQALPDDRSRQLALLDFLAAQRPFEVAEPAYRQAIVQRPQDAEFGFALARLYRAAQRPADAQRVLVSIATQNKRLQERLAASDLLAADALAAGHADEAGRWIAEVIERNPRDHDALLLRARLRLDQKQSADAVADLREALRDSPGAPDIVGLLALAHRAAGEPALAREVVAQALQTRPDDPALRLLLAADLADGHEPAAAAAELEEIIRRAPRDLQAYEAKAQLALARHDREGAERAYRQATVAVPEAAGPWVQLAGLRAQRGDLNGALDLLERRSRERPADEAIQLAHAELLVRAGRHDEAIAAYEVLHALAPADAAIRNNLAYLLTEARGDRSSLLRALALMRGFEGSQVASYLDSLGWIHYRLGDYATAVALLERAAGLAPDAPLLQLHLGMALSRSGDAARGSQILHKVLLNPGLLPLADEARKLLAQG
jgi:tetratricopeptide (TPR) repeat protein